MAAADGNEEYRNPWGDDDALGKIAQRGLEASLSLLPFSLPPLISLYVF
jgi:hypothetical protein